MNPIARLFHRAPYHKRGANAGGKTIILSAEECRTYVGGLRECQDMHETLLECREHIAKSSPGMESLLRRINRALAGHG